MVRHHPVLYLPHRHRDRLLPAPPRPTYSAALSISQAAPQALHPDSILRVRIHPIDGCLPRAPYAIVIFLMPLSRWLYSVSFTFINTWITVSHGTVRSSMGRLVIQYIIDDSWKISASCRRVGVGLREHIRVLLRIVPLLFKGKIRLFRKDPRQKRKR